MQRLTHRDDGPLQRLEEAARQSERRGRHQPADGQQRRRVTVVDAVCASAQLVGARHHRRRARIRLLSAVPGHRAGWTRRRTAATQPYNQRTVYGPASGRRASTTAVTAWGRNSASIYTGIRRAWL